MFLPYTATMDPIDVAPGSVILRPEYGDAIRVDTAEFHESGESDDDYVIGTRMTGTYLLTDAPYDEVIGEGMEVEVITERTEQWLLSDEAAALVGLHVPEK